MRHFRTIATFVLLMTCVTTYGQQLDSVQVDLKHLSNTAFFKKYSIYNTSISSEDIRATKLIWSLEQVRRVSGSLRKKGVKTVTIVDNRPSKENPYYIIGFYQLPTPDHLSRIGFYKVDIAMNKIYYQSLSDLIKNKWKRVK